MTARQALGRAQIDHVAGLASLSLKDEEADRLGRELDSILAYVEELALVDTGDVAEQGATGAAIGAAAWRADVAEEGLSHEEALRGAPGATDQGFSVPGFLGGGAGAGGPP